MASVSENTGNTDKTFNETTDAVRSVSQAQLDHAFGSDLIRQTELVKISEAVWQAVPLKQRGAYTTANWREDIYQRCRPALEKAADQLQRNNGDDPRLLTAKLGVLRQAFIRQVERAMQDVSDKYRKGSAA